MSENDIETIECLENRCIWYDTCDHKLKKNIKNGIIEICICEEIHWEKKENCNCPKCLGIENNY